ncbi:isoprenyl transferase [Paenibacillus doosanensis]|uniref:Isoprenyl transferase n=1 Tax=Paenibacillus konkukensis TaxID=2020716 RepID=A0ABY4S071_9BACL|nr:MULTISPECIES: isoprenyl transferase [Paenibacillus]MCS7461861.1 isoprenyl transferase [Paenibacillus doosanensis]UQZ87370.1 Ditrans,polycis-undecaprenyl-diphosphate synthase ((2E,6E)-farnesyl-diphosphate specific) [Paenibacillus konkukensis]
MMPFKKWFGSKSQNEEWIERIDSENIPSHVAVIMDGNGRWAQKRGLPRVAGHHSGMKNVKKITMAADAIGVKVLTMYAFSTENWKRPREEVEYLMKLPLEFFPKEIDELIANNVQIRMTGWHEGVPDYTMKAIQDAIDQTKHNTGLILNFALNYGSRREMLQGVKRLTEDVVSGKISLDAVDEAMFSSYLLTHPLPDPDLLIRTSGELRISNFLMWQLAYSELWFTELCWPEFTEKHFYEAIQEYQRRARRYGGL